MRIRLIVTVDPGERVSLEADPGDERTFKVDVRGSTVLDFKDQIDAEWLDVPAALMELTFESTAEEPVSSHTMRALIHSNM